jgi:hypothetical protein
MFLLQVGVIAIVPAQLVYLALKGWTRAAPVWVTLGLWHMARNPLQYSWLVLMLVMVTGLGVLATTVGGTLNRSYEERVYFDTASDIRVTGIPAYFATGVDAMKQRYLRIEGVTDVSLAVRGTGGLGSSGTGRSFQILGLESQDFQYMTWYREDFSERPLTGVMRALQPPVRIEPVRLPSNAREISVWVKPDDYYSNMFVWFVLSDARGLVRTVTLGRVGDTNWHQIRAEVPSNMLKPVDLVSVQIYEPVFGPVGTAGSIRMDSILTTNSNGSTTVLEDFESQQRRWSPLATSLLSTDNVFVSGNEPYEGGGSGVFVFGKDTDRGIRGFYQSPTGGPMPVVASTNFMRYTGVNVGDTIIVSVIGRLIPITVRDTVEYFPTMRHTPTGFILTDLDSLLRHVNIVSPSSSLQPNEAFVNQANGAGDTVHQALVSLAGSDEAVRHRERLLEAIRLDPLIAAGWKALVLLSVGVIFVTAGLGYMVYLLSFADAGRSEMGFLQSLGFSTRQILALLVLEHLVIVLIGLGLGTWAGFQMSTLMVSSVAVTEDGGQLIPPFILMTDWSFMLAIYGFLLAIFVIALTRLARSMTRLNLYATSRVEG